MLPVQQKRMFVETGRVVFNKPAGWHESIRGRDTHHQRRVTNARARRMRLEAVLRISGELVPVPCYAVASVPGESSSGGRRQALTVVSLLDLVPAHRLLNGRIVPVCSM